MGKVAVRADVAKTELQHSHAGNIQSLAQGVHVGRDVTQVLGKKWKAAERVAQMMKQVVSGPIHPATVLGRFFSARNLPELGKAAEMVEPDVIEVPRSPAH